MKHSFKYNDSDNIVKIGENVIINGEIIGNGNKIEIGGTRRETVINLFINGNNNNIKIGPHALFNNLHINIGSKRWVSSETNVTIGNNFSIGGKGKFILPNSGNVLVIGDKCMFSNAVTIRGGEYPHLIFDLSNNDYCDESEGIFIGDHSWIGEGVYINKSVTIPRECIVGARSVVTKRFTAENAVIAGNPARVVKEGVQWVANIKALPEFPALKESFERSRMHVINMSDGNPIISSKSPEAGKGD